MREWAKLGRSASIIPEGAGIPELLRSYKDKEFQKDAQKALAAIADETKPLISLKTLR